MQHFGRFRCEADIDLAALTESGFMSTHLKNGGIAWGETNAWRRVTTILSSASRLGRARLPELVRSRVRDRARQAHARLSSAPGRRPEARSGRRGTRPGVAGSIRARAFSSSLSLAMLASSGAYQRGRITRRIRGADAHGLYLADSSAPRFAER